MSDDQTPHSQAMAEEDPCAPPSPASGKSEAKALRDSHRTQEASIRGIGALFILSGVYITLSALMSFAAFSSWVDAQLIGNCLGFIGWGLFQILAGLLVRKFEKWGRITCLVHCACYLLWFPTGIAIGVCFLYALLEPKVSLVFSERYQEAVRLTPELAFRAPIRAWVFLGILIGWIYLIAH